MLAATFVAASILPRGAHRSLHDAANTAAMQRTAPPGGRRISAGVVAKAPPSLHNDLESLRSKIQKTNLHVVCFSLTLWFLRGAQDPIPSRTRPSNPSAPMVLSLKTWESRSLQGLPKTHKNSPQSQNQKAPASRGGFVVFGPGLFPIPEIHARGETADVPPSARIARHWGSALLIGPATAGVRGVGPGCSE